MTYKPAQTLRILAVIILAVLFTAPAHGVQVQTIVRLKGAENNTLVGLGLVVGLNGTGDKGNFQEAQKKLAIAIARFGNDNVIPADLSDSRNVALVTLSATLPAGGVREGDRVDVKISAVGNAKSLAGGRLFMAPMTGPLPNSPVYAYASGDITIEDSETPTSGVVVRGAQLVQSIWAQYFDEFGRITLVINDDIATWPVARNLANVINANISPDGPDLAQPIDQKNIIIEVPMTDRANPSAFISRVMTTYIDPDFLPVEERIVINEKTGAIVISGDVQIAPVVISYKGLTITTLTPPPTPTPQQPLVEQQSFIGMDPENRGGARLADLLNAFNQLQVSAADRIAIIKELKRSGKLYAKVIMQ